LQNIAITLLIIQYSGRNSAKGESNTPRLIITGFAATIGAYSLYTVPFSTLQALQVATVPLSLFSKVPQIFENYKAKSTGQLSAFAVVSQILGCIARVFTTFTEVNDPVVLVGFVVALVLNLVLGAQIWQYWGKSPEPASQAESKVAAPSQSQEKKKIDVVASTSALPASAGGRRWARKVD